MEVWQAQQAGCRRRYRRPHKQRTYAEEDQQHAEQQPRRNNSNNNNNNNPNRLCKRIDSNDQEAEGEAEARAIHMAQATSWWTNR